MNSAENSNKKSIIDVLAEIIVYNPSLMEENNRAKLLLTLKSKLIECGLPKNEVAQSLLNFNSGVVSEASMGNHPTSKYVPAEKYVEDLKKGWLKVNRSGKSVDIVKELHEFPLENVDISRLEKKLSSGNTNVIYIGQSTLSFLPEKIDILSESLTFWVSKSPALSDCVFTIERGSKKTLLFTDVGRSGKSGSVDKNSLFKVGDGTSQKEGLVCYGYFMGEANLQKTIHLLRSKVPQDASASLNEHGIKMLKLDAVLKYLDVPQFQDWLKVFHSMPISQIQKDPMYKTVMNAFSSASTLLKLFGKRVYIDRGKGEAFGSIRKQAIKIAKQLNLNIDEDKWCPADIYLYNRVPRSIASYSTLSTIGNEVGLNSLFASDATDDAIVAVSLKEEKAIQGKSTGFLNIAKEFSVEELKNFPTALTKEEKKVITDASSKVGAMIQKIVASLGVENDPELNTLAKSKTWNIGALYNFKAVKNNPPIRKKLEALDNSLKAQYQTNINNFKRMRKLFYNSVSKYGVKNPGSEDSIPLDAMVKKTVCYRIAMYIVNEKFFELTKKKLQTEGIDSQAIKFYDNPFVALCAYAIGIGGMNPTFWKVTGHEDGTSASYVKFQGNTVLKTEQNFNMSVSDSDASSGLEILYNVTANVETSEGQTKKQRHFVVKITFRFSTNSVQIEVNEFKEKV